MFEIRFHGRGGQGAVTASKILALAAFKEGKYAVSFPFFGTERRGAPVTACTRIEPDPILLKTQVYTPDAVIVLDSYVMNSADVMNGLDSEGFLIVNTSADPEKISRSFRVATVDATAIAVDHGLGNRTNPIINTAMIGALSKVTGIISRNAALSAVRELSPRKKDENASAADQAYDLVKIGWAE
jgi:2-oxoacid:acceptor oxidoreductase gamma subunit (pyruvate/2-ketoisovalerate family)